MNTLFLEPKYFKGASVYNQPLFSSVNKVSVLLMLITCNKSIFTQILFNWNAFHNIFWLTHNRVWILEQFTMIICIIRNLYLLTIHDNIDFVIFKRLSFIITWLYKMSFILRFSIGPKRIKAKIVSSTSILK